MQGSSSVLNLPQKIMQAAFSAKFSEDNRGELGMQYMCVKSVIMIVQTVKKTMTFAIFADKFSCNFQELDIIYLLFHQLLDLLLWFLYNICHFFRGSILSTCFPPLKIYTFCEIYHFL